jgi:hypothetical protein
MLEAGGNTDTTQTGDTAAGTSHNANADVDGHEERGDEREGSDGRNGIDDDDGNGSDSNSDSDDEDADEDNSNDSNVTDAGHTAVTDNAGDPTAARSADSTAGSGNDATLPDADPSTGAAAETTDDDGNSDDDGIGSISDNTESDDDLDGAHCRVLVRTAGTGSAANGGGEQNGPGKALAPVSGGLLIPRGKQTASLASGLVAAWGNC